MIRNVYLTSFRQSHSLPAGVVPYSAAVYQPRGYSYPKVAWTDIRRESGEWIRPRQFLHAERPLEAYRDALLKLYESRLLQAQTWAEQTEHDVALCCWCPHDRAAKRQLEEWGSFVCHTAVLSEFIYKRLLIAVWEDGERRHMAVLAQKGIAS